MVRVHLPFCGESKFLLRLSRDILLVLLPLFICLAGAQEILADNEDPYSNLVVGIQSGLSDCENTINDFRDLLEEASRALYYATDRKLAFLKVTLVVPAEMADNCGARLNDPELQKVPEVSLTLGMDHPVFGKNPWTQQTRGCGKPGDLLYLPYNFLRKNDTQGNISLKAKMLVQEWAKYRWGVFEEYGLEGDPTYPLSYPKAHSVQNGTHWMPNYCVNSNLNGNFQPGCEHPDCRFEFDSAQNASTSLLALHEVNSISYFCGNLSHDSSIPTKHNSLCEGRSIKEIYQTHPDYHLPPRFPEQNIQLNFTILDKKASRQYFLLIDETYTMGALPGRWEMLMSAAKQWIMEDVLDESEVGIVTFHINSSMRINATVVNETTRDFIANSLPSIPSSHNEKNLSRALFYVNSQSRDGATVLLVVDPKVLSDKSSDLIKEAGSNVIWPILYPVSTADKLRNISQLQDLASATGGQMLMIEDMTFSNFSKITQQSVSVQQVAIQHMRKVQERTYSNARHTLPILITQQELLTAKSTFSFLVGNNIDPNQTLTLLTYSTMMPSKVTLNSNPPQNLVVHEVTNTSFKTYITGLQSGVQNITIQFPNSVESHWAEILAMEANEGVIAEFWASHDLGYLTLLSPADPVILFTKVTKGNLPVVGADVEVILEKKGMRETLVLRDSGGGPDVTGNDGIYSAHWTFAHKGKGIYNIYLQIRSTDTTKTIGQDDITEGIVCCGGSLNLNLLPRNNIEAFLDQKVGTSFVKSAASSNYDIFAPIRVTDLRGVVEFGMVNLTFTAPGDDLTRGYAFKYVVWWWDADKADWSEVQATTYTIVEGGTLANVAFIAPKCNQLLQYRVTARDTRLKEGKFSNIVNIILPCNMKPKPPPIQYTCPTHTGAIVGAIFGGAAMVILPYLLFLAYRWKKQKDAMEAKEQRANNHEMAESSRTNTQGHTNRGFVSGVQDIYRRRPRLNKSKERRQNQDRELPITPKGSRPGEHTYYNAQTPSPIETIYGDFNDAEGQEVYETVAVPTYRN